MTSATHATRSGVSRATHWPLRAGRAVLRHYPLNTPRVRLLRRLPAIPEGFGSFRVKGAVTIAACYPNDYVSKSLFWLGDFEPWVLAVMARLIRPGDTVLDVGANIGAMTLRFARWAGPEGRVFSFEPCAANAERLRANVEANGLANVTVIEEAMSSRSGSVRMVVPGAQPSHASVVRSPAADAATVTCRTVDQFLASRGIERVDACKIDVEGHEPEVFAGMERALEQRVIRAFVFEREGLAADAADATVDRLRDGGYRVYRIVKRPLGTRIVEHGRANGHGRVTNDVVALAPGVEVPTR